VRRKTSMKLGIICPVKHLQDFATQSDFHLILPHLYNEFPEYKEFYRERIKQGDFVLQDNSIFEAGTSLDCHYLLEQAEDLGVSEMAAPEVLGDADESKKLLVKFLDYRETMGSKIPVFATVQGKTFQDMLDYFFELNGIDEVSTIGIPSDTDYVSSYSYGYLSPTLKKVFNRLGLVQEIEKTRLIGNIEIKPVHLLGLGDGVELQRQKYISWIRSCDSSTAYVHGAEGICYGMRGLPCEKITDKLDFGSSLGRQLQFHAVHYNIQMLKQFVKM